MKLHASPRLASAVDARSRARTELEPGQWVAIHRNTSFGRGSWNNLGVLIMVRGVSHRRDVRGELWKCSREQLRPAENEEAAGSEVLQGLRAQACERLSRSDQRHGFHDVRRQVPEEDLAPSPAPGAPQPGPDTVPPPADVAPETLPMPPSAGPGWNLRISPVALRYASCTDSRQNQQQVCCFRYEWPFLAGILTSTGANNIERRIRLVVPRRLGL